jgi:hypothetical protein
MTNPKIPETFLTVITKMNPEISNVEIEVFDVITLINPSTFNLDERIKVIVNLHMNKEHKLKGNRENYSEILNTLFIYTYPDYHFISFKVKSLHLPQEKTNMEKFHELFYTKQV